MAEMIYQLGTGGIAGFLVGYCVKKLLKVLAAVAGFFILALAYLEYNGVVHVNTQRLTDLGSQAITNIVTTGAGSSLLSQAVSAIPFAGSFILGAIVGLEKA